MALRLRAGTARAADLQNSSAFVRVKRAGDIGKLTVTTARVAARPPFPWLADAVLECSDAIKRCTKPLAITHSAYVLGFGIILFGGVVETLGTSDRLAGGLWFAWTREVATWITAMIFAGIVGSAMAADIGARKIRDELDALAVLGVETTRSLVVPRVIATTVALPVLAMLSTVLVTGINYLVAPPYLHFSRGAFADSLSSFIYPIDLLVPLLLKNAILGFFIGVVACYKGITCGAGTAGVGRAVNQCVVITFFGVWMFNSLFNLAYVTLFPDLVALKG